ncbi:hypothetical protein LPJ57_010877, partial [Coemansia sp. RSA 486]
MDHRLIVEKASGLADGLVHIPLIVLFGIARLPLADLNPVEPIKKINAKGGEVPDVDRSESQRADKRRSEPFLALESRRFGRRCLGCCQRRSVNRLHHRRCNFCHVDGCARMGSNRQCRLVDGRDAGKPIQRGNHQMRAITAPCHVGDRRVVQPGHQRHRASTHRRIVHRHAVLRRHRQHHPSRFFFVAAHPVITILPLLKATRRPSCRHHRFSVTAKTQHRCIHKPVACPDKTRIVCRTRALYAGCGGHQAAVGGDSRPPEERCQVVVVEQTRSTHRPY